MRILLLPPDTGSVHTWMPAMYGAIAGHDVIVPPATVYGAVHERNNLRPLLEYLIDHGPVADALLVSVDAAIYGGMEHLTGNRTSIAVAQTRLEQLEAAIRPHAARTTLFSFGTPPTIPATSTETFQFVEDFRRLVAIQRSPAGTPGAMERDQLKQRIPDAVLDSYENARRRNHEIQLQLIGDILRGAAARAVIFAADPPAGAASAVMMNELHLRSSNLNIMFLPVERAATAMLTAMTILDQDPKVISCSIMLSDAPGLGRVPVHEHVAFRETLHRILRPLGLVIDTSGVAGSQAVDLFIHTPVPASRDLYTSDLPAPGPDLTEFVQCIERACAVGPARPAVLADCGHAHGADPWLIKRIKKATSGALSVFAASGTAADTLGFALSNAALLVQGDRNGAAPAPAARRVTLARWMDDYLFQTIARMEFARRCRREGVDRFNTNDLPDEYHDALDARMHELASEWLPQHLPPFEARFGRRGLNELIIDWKT